MPQLDFTIWFINLMTCWTMFFIVFTATQNIINNSSISSNESIIINFSNNNWTW